MKRKKISRSLEDYLEAIHILIEQHDVARASGIAELLKVSRASVTGALKNLSELGLINYSPYSLISLTDKGIALGENIHHRHTVLKKFFIDVLSLPSPDAEEAACSIEHSVNEDILQRLILLGKTFDEHPDLLDRLKSITKKD